MRRQGDAWHRPYKSEDAVPDSVSQPVLSESFRATRSVFRFIEPVEKGRLPVRTNSKAVACSRRPCSLSFRENYLQCLQFRCGWMLVIETGVGEGSDPSVPCLHFEIV